MTPCFLLDIKYKVYFSTRCFLSSSDIPYFPQHSSNVCVSEIPLIAIGVMGQYYSSYNPLRASLRQLAKNGYEGLFGCVQRYIGEWRGDVPIVVRDCKVIGRLRREKGEELTTLRTSAAIARVKRVAEEQLPRQHKRVKIGRNAKLVKTEIRRGKSAERRWKSGDRDSRIRRRNLVGKIVDRRSVGNELSNSTQTSDTSPTPSTCIPPTSYSLSETQLPPNATTLESVFSFSLPSPSTSPTPAQETPPKIPSREFIDLTTKVLPNAT